MFFFRFKQSTKSNDLEKLQDESVELGEQMTTMGNNGLQVYSNGHVYAKPIPVGQTSVYNGNQSSLNIGYDDDDENDEIEF